MTFSKNEQYRCNACNEVKSIWNQKRIPLKFKIGTTKGEYVGVCRHCYKKVYRLGFSLSKCLERYEYVFRRKEE